MSLQPFMRFLEESHTAWLAMRNATDAWLFTAILAIVLPALGYLRFRRLLAGGQRTFDTPRKLAIYARIVSTQWLLVLAMYLLLRRHGLTLADAGLRVADAFITLGAAGMLAIAVPVAGAGAVRRARQAGPDGLGAGLKRLRGIVPVNGIEMAGFAVVCVTAGICEELLFRGWLVNMTWAVCGSLWASVLIAAALFGIGHAYQGVRGILKTGSIGILLGLLFALTGSLIPGQVFHAGIDLLAAVVAMTVTRATDY
jgi:membrane protease YdiL (CAAX protease family)